MKSMILIMIIMKRKRQLSQKLKSRGMIRLQARATRQVAREATSMERMMETSRPRQRRWR